MKFAFLVCFELRCLKHIDKIYKYIVDYYDADIFICVQETPDVEEKIKLFNRKVKKIKIIKKTDNAKINYFQNKKLDTHGAGNFKTNSILNFYINLIEMGEFIKEDIENYDYFILLRTDIDILFEFPPKKFFKKIPPTNYTFDAKYSRKYGGFGLSIFTHQNYIYQILTCYKNVLQNNKLIKKYYKEKNFRVPNQETFSNYCLKVHDLKINDIKNLNFYFTADDFNTLSPRTTIFYSKKYKTYYKYERQLQESQSNYNLVKNKFVWKLNKNLHFYLRDKNTIKK